MAHTMMAIIMKGKPPQNPANPDEILLDKPPTKVIKRAVPMKPAISLTVYDNWMSSSSGGLSRDVVLQPARGAQQAVVFLGRANQLHPDRQAGFADQQGQGDTG